MYLSIPSKSAPAWECLARDYAPGSPEWASTLASAATLNGKHTQPQSWQRACKTARWMQHLSGPTFSPSTLAPGLEQWIASLRASRARTCPLRGDGPGLMANEAASSSTSSILPTLAVRDTSFWRTSQASLLPPPPLWTKPKGLSTSARPPASWENWPTAGGMRNGSLFQRPTWAPAMGGKGGFAGRGENWPTPDTRAGHAQSANVLSSRDSPQIAIVAAMWMPPNVPNGGRHVPQELVASKGTMEDGTKRTVGLESQTKYWATPKANDAEKRGDVAHRPHMPELVGQAQAWPTPKGTDGTKGGPNQAGSKGDLMLPRAAAQWPTPMTVNTTSNRAKYGRETSGPSRGGARFGLEDIVNTWPTPAARDSKGANSAEHALITGGGAQAYGPTEQLRPPFFAPGPADARWPAILREWPGLAPALDKTAESGLRGVADGLASGMDHCRAQRLKCVGNGVVALQAAAAAVVLVRRMMETA